MYDEMQNFDYKCHVKARCVIFCHRNSITFNVCCRYVFGIKIVLTNLCKWKFSVYYGDLYRIVRIEQYYKPLLLFICTNNAPI